MVMFRWIAAKRGQNRMVKELAARISARCRAAVWGRVFPVVATMDPAQSRGFIRARAALVVSREILIGTSRLNELPPELMNQVRDLVLDDLVHAIQAEVGRHRPVTLGELRAA